MYQQHRISERIDTESASTGFKTRCYTANITVEANFGGKQHPFLPRSGTSTLLTFQYHKHHCHLSSYKHVSRNIRRSASSFRQLWSRIDPRLHCQDDQGSKRAKGRFRHCSEREGQRHCWRREPSGQKRGTASSGQGGSQEEETWL